MRRLTRNLSPWIVSAALAVAGGGATVCAAPYYLVSAELNAAGMEAGLYRLEDVNGDGDALDAGENALWGRGLAAAGDVRRFGDAILAADAERGRLVRYRDVNGDGDALDAGESIVWADGMTALYGFDTSGDVAIAADIATGIVYRMADVNGDGDALDAGERTPYAAGVDAPISVLIHGAETFVASVSGGGVRRLADTNGDGDALDSAENAPFSALGVSQATGLFRFDDGRLLLSSLATDTVYEIQDRNGDGDALDIVELRSYASPTFGLIDGPWNMARHEASGVLLVEYDDGQVSLLRDVNGDGDALDIGESVPWATGLTRPVGIVGVPEPGSLALAIFAATVGGWRRRRRLR